MTTQSETAPRGAAAGLSHWFVAVVALFVTALITANIVAVKLIDVAGMVLPAAIIVFPVSYIIGDVLTEVYGFRQARRVIWLGFACNLLAVVVIWLAEESPISPLSTPCASRINDNSGQVSPSVMAIDSAAARQTIRLRRRSAGDRTSSVMATTAAGQSPSESGLKLVSRS